MTDTPPDWVLIEAKEAGAAEERAKIVAWLHSFGYRQIADAIETQEHLK